MRIRIRARDAHLKARGFRGGCRRGDQPDGGGAVLQTPGDGDGRPEVLDEPFVGVYGGGDEGHDVWEAVEEAGEEMPAEVGEVGEVGVWRVGVNGAAVKEIRGRGGVGNGDVHVAGVAGEALAGFGHEAGGDSVFAADRLDDVSGVTMSVAIEEERSCCREGC